MHSKRLCRAARPHLRHRKRAVRTSWAIRSNAFKTSDLLSLQMVVLISAVSAILDEPLSDQAARSNREFGQLLTCRGVCMHPLGTLTDAPLRALSAGEPSPAIIALRHERRPFGKPKNRCHRNADACTDRRKGKDHATILAERGKNENRLLPEPLSAKERIHNISGQSRAAKLP